MKEMDVLLKTVSEGLRILAQGVKVIADKLDTFVDQNGGDTPRARGRREPVREPPVKRAGAKAPRKPLETSGEGAGKAGRTAQRVYEAMRRINGPVEIDRLVKETGYNKKQIHNALYKLKKQGKAENVGKAVYRAVA